MTSQDWKRYAEELERHELFCKHMKIAFDRAIWLLEHCDNLEFIKTTLYEELSRTQSMDAPNMPGYYRANND